MSPSQDAATTREQMLAPREHRNHLPLAATRMWRGNDKSSSVKVASDGVLRSDFFEPPYARSSNATSLMPGSCQRPPQPTLNHVGSAKEQNAADCSRGQMKNLPMEISKRNALVLLDRRFRFLGIATCASRRDLLTFFEGNSRK